MRIVRYLQHWLTGCGLCLQVGDFVPEPHLLRQWADTFPCAALVAAVDAKIAQRFPAQDGGGRAGPAGVGIVETRVVLFGRTDSQPFAHRLSGDVCLGASREIHVDRTQGPCCCP